MEVKKGYKQTELGLIPKDWHFKKFEDVMTGFSSGQTPSRARPEYYRGQIRWITSGELNYNIITDTVEKITQEAVDNTHLKKIPKGTFLIAITGLEAAGTRGSCGIVGEESTTNQSCMALYPTKELITEYLFHFYVRYGNQLAFKYCQGTKQQSYTGKIARILPIALPPTTKEQSAIAAVLSETDSLIMNLEKLITKKEAVKKGTMQALLTGKKRLPGFNGKWQKKKIKRLFKFLSTANNSRSELSDEGEIGYIHYGDIHTKWNEFLDASTECIPFIKKEKIKDVPFLENGDLLIADASEDYEGLCACIELVNVKHRKIVGGLHTLLLRGSKAEIADGFKGYLPYLKGFKEAVIRAATGISVYGISKKNLGDIEITIPDTIEQSAIAGVITDMATEIRQLEENLQKYKMVKQGMMQNLLTGKIRLV